jgi:hypothetical protein
VLLFGIGGRSGLGGPMIAESYGKAKRGKELEA